MLNQIAEKNPADVEPELRAEVLVGLGISEGSKQDLQKSLAYLDQALAIYRKLKADNPSAYSAELARTLRNVGYTYFRLGNNDLALENYTESLKWWRNLSDDVPKQYRADLANILYDIANAYQTAGEIIPAKTAYLESLDLFNALDRENTKAFLTSRAFIAHDLGRLLHQQKLYEEAIGYYLDSLENYREIADQNPEVYWPGLALVLMDLGLCYWEKDKDCLEEAESCFIESLGVFEKLAEKRPREFGGASGDIANKLGILSEQNGKLQQAGQYFQQAVKIYRQLNLKYPDAYITDLSGTTNNLALYNRNIRHDYVESERLYTESLNLLRDAATKDPRYNADIAGVLLNLASLWLIQWQTTKDSDLKEKMLAQCEEAETMLSKVAAPGESLNAIKQGLEEVRRQLQA